MVAVRGPRSRTDDEQTAEGEQLTLHEIAYLAGGGWRLAETALARMLLEARVEIDRHGTVRVVRPRPRDEVEATLLAALGPSGTGWLGAPRSALGPSAPARRLEEGLRRRGLIVGGTGPGKPDRGRPLLLPTWLAGALLVVVAVVTVRVSAVLGVNPGLAFLLSALVPLLIAHVLSRYGTPAVPTGPVGPYWRPARRVEPLLAALRTGAPLPPGWHLPPDALAPAGRTTWAAVAATGVEALQRHRLTAAVRGDRPRRRARRHPTPPGARPGPRKSATS